MPELQTILLLLDFHFFLSRGKQCSVNPLGSACGAPPPSPSSVESIRCPGGHWPAMVLTGLNFPLALSATRNARKPFLRAKTLKKPQQKGLKSGAPKKFNVFKMTEVKCLRKSQLPSFSHHRAETTSPQSCTSK